MNTRNIKLHAVKSIPAITCLFIALSTGSLAQAAQYDNELHQVQQQWAQAMYKVSDKSGQQQALETLAKTTTNLNNKYPNTAALLIWDGIVNSTLAGVKGGIGALGLAKKSRDQLERARQLEPDALNGSAYTSLGTLYAKVPGWPIAFGDKNKAGTYLQQALKINPQGIDPNYFYAEYLSDKGQTAKAIEHLQTAMRAPARPGRALADAGRKLEVRQLLDKLQQKQ